MSKKIYCAGPMTGFPELNFPMFFDAEEYLKAEGWKVISPARLTIAMWCNKGLIKSPDDWRKCIGSPEEKKIPIEEYMRTDFAMLSTCDAIAFLPGWNKSEGSGKELKLAEMLNLPMFELWKLTGVRLWNMNELDVKGRKWDGLKRQWHLVWRPFFRGVVDILTFGAVKYAPDNWKFVPDAKQRYQDAMERHVDAYNGGEVIDPETGKSHLYHVGCCAMFLDWFDSPEGLKQEEELKGKNDAEI